MAAQDAGVRVEVEGLTQLQRSLRQARDTGLNNQMKAANLAAAKDIVAESKRRAPHRTGALAGSIRASGTIRNARVRIGSARVPYAPPIHWGWPRRHIRPQPFVRQAIEQQKDSIRHRYQQEIQHLMNEIGAR